MRLLTFLFLTLMTPIFCAQHTFVLQDIDSGETLVQEGDVESYMAPYCTFNIALSVIGFDSQILQSPTHPVWPFKEQYKEEYLSWNEAFPEKWAVEHHPTSWMQHSCVWFSQQLTGQLGVQTFADYVRTLQYGNQDLVGDAGKANGLTHAWIGSSLRISAFEQVDFMKKLVKLELPVSKQAQECTKAILFVENLDNGMALYGKTGSGDHAHGREEPDLRVGWFVGWAEKENKRLAFAYRIHGTESGTHITGPAAKEELKQRLEQLTILK